MVRLCAEFVVLPYRGSPVRNHPVLHQAVHTPAIHPDIRTPEEQDSYFLDMSEFDLDEFHLLPVEHFLGDHSLHADCEGVESAYQEGTLYQHPRAQCCCKLYQCGVGHNHPDTSSNRDLETSNGFEEKDSDIRYLSSGSFVS